MKASNVVLVAALASGSFAAALPAQHAGGNDISTLGQNKGFWNWIKQLCERRKKNGNNWGGGHGGNFPDFPGGFPGGGNDDGNGFPGGDGNEFPDADNEFPDNDSGFPDDGTGGFPDDGTGNPDNGAGSPDNGTGIPDDGTGGFPDDETGGFPDDGTGNPGNGDSSSNPSGGFGDDNSVPDPSGFPGAVNTKFPPDVPITKFPVMNPTGNGIFPTGVFPTGTGSGIAFPTGSGSVFFPVDPISDLPTQSLPSGPLPTDPQVLPTPVTPITPITPITPSPGTPTSIQGPGGSVGLPVVSDSAVITNVGTAPAPTGTRSFDNVKFTTKSA